MKDQDIGDKDKQDFLLGLMNYQGAYHHHKEKMTWVATALFGAYALASVGWLIQLWADGSLAGHKTVVASAGAIFIVFMAGLTGLFLWFQLTNRMTAAKRVEKAMERGKCISYWHCDEIEEIDNSTHDSMSDRKKREKRERKIMWATSVGVVIFLTAVQYAALCFVLNTPPPIGRPPCEHFALPFGPCSDRSGSESLSFPKVFTNKLSGSSCIHHNSPG